MKNIYLSLSLSMAFIPSLTGQVKVGDNPNSIDGSAVFEVESTNKGVLIPRMTSAQRQAIASPAAGLQVYDTNANALYYYNGTNWVEVSPSSNSSNMFNTNGTIPSSTSRTIGLDGGSSLNIDNNTLYVDGDNNRIGIGTASPTQRLDVVGTARFDGGLTLNSFFGGSWIDMPTTGPSGIGSGGTGQNAWIAYINAAGNYFANGQVGDIAYRNNSGKILWGNGSGNAGMALNNDSLGIGTINPSERFDLVGNLKFSGALMPGGAAGTSGQILVSNGAGAAPTWTNATEGDNLFNTNGGIPASTTRRIDLSAGSQLDIDTGALFIDGNLRRVGIGTNGPGYTLDVNGTAQFHGGAQLNFFSGGTWLNMPTTGPSGIGNGGPGANAWIAYAWSNGNYFNNALAGDVVYRNSTGRLLWGNTSGDAIMALNNNRLGLGTSTPDQSALVEIASTSQGFLPPRMTTAQRDAIANPAQGLVVYNTSTNCLNYYSGSIWIAQCGLPEGTVSSLDCVGPIVSGYLYANQPLYLVSVDLAYTNGNGGMYNSQSVSSTGVTGLTATLVSGNFTVGNGTVTFRVTGSPSAAGTATFPITLGGQSCSFNVTVAGAAVHNPCNPGNPTPIVDVVNSTTGKTWMDRNLGANRAGLSDWDAEAFGSLFQWGRASDGHECVGRQFIGEVVVTSPTTTVLASSSVPNAGNSWDGSFVLADVAPYDWLMNQNDNLWQGVNGTNNPCPTGYRLPTQAEWEAERLSWNPQNASGAFASPLKLTTAGYRHWSNGTIQDEINDGHYWASNFNSQDRTSSSLLIWETYSATYSTSSRVLGRSVRCIKN